MRRCCRLGSPDESWRRRQSRGLCSLPLSALACEDCGSMLPSLINMHITTYTKSCTVQLRTNALAEPKAQHSVYEYGTKASCSEAEGIHKIFCSHLSFKRKIHHMAVIVQLEPNPGHKHSGPHIHRTCLYLVHRSWRVEPRHIPLSRHRKSGPHPQTV